MVWRVLCWLTVFVLAAHGACRAEAGWAGVWDPHWLGGHGRLVLTEAGTGVTGRFPLYRGHVIGTAEGRG